MWQGFNHGNYVHRRRSTACSGVGKARKGGIVREGYFTALPPHPPLVLAMKRKGVEGLIFSSSWNMFDILFWKI
ncbi:hypothetical protein COCVIDRAFT_115080 [Bipolaris victoriae FI3]|uniref:Uncharacterized protein n=1 Tax=Bipolaris victoriae (strain FI3) TaxID=930091 RepID=W7EAC9_BIPV3|nr:hypothetical protein COCVIDRAFT_115080 [Bipolaris victoriae FI3]